MSHSWKDSTLHDEDETKRVRWQKKYVKSKAIQSRDGFPCVDKLAFTTYERAVARALDRTDMTTHDDAAVYLRVYRCRYCAHYHLTKNTFLEINRFPSVR